MKVVWVVEKFGDPDGWCEELEHDSVGRHKDFLVMDEQGVAVDSGYVTEECLADLGQEQAWRFILSRHT